MDHEMHIDSSHQATKLALQKNNKHHEDAAIVSSTSGFLAGNSNPDGKPRTLAEHITNYHADVVEWCPNEKFNDLLICGTYELKEDEKETWKGDLTLGQLSPNPLSPTGYSLKILDSVEMPSGVFDIQWKPKTSESDTFVAVCEDGTMQFFQLNREDTNGTMTIQKEDMVALCKEEKIKPLFVDWFSSHEMESRLAVSDSTGHLNHFMCSDKENIRRWGAHGFEAWVASFDCHNPNIIYSGGDDCLLKGWDLRTDLKIPTFQSRRHSMGVTTVRKNHKLDHILVSGSYDEHILLWDTRKMKLPLSDLQIQNGGIWRVTWHPVLSNYLATAAMHAGFHIINVKEDSSLSIETSYRAHRSLAYGVDWQQVAEPSVHNKHTIASCSFYDNQLNIWEIGLNVT